MDKNELHEHLQWVAGMALSIEDKIQSAPLGMADYLDIQNAIDGMQSELEKARKIQYEI